MSVWYVRSTTGSDGNSGASWALAKATIAGGLAVALAGDTVYVSQAHAETQATSITWTCAGTSALPVNIICVSDSAGPPTAVATTATVTTTGASNITFNGCAYFYGITINCGTGASAANIIVCAASASGYAIFDTCKLALLTTSTSSLMYLSQSYNDTLIEFRNTTVKFSSVSQKISFYSCLFFWKNTANAIDTGGSIPTYLFSGGARAGMMILKGVDLSAMGSGKTLFNMGTFSSSWSARLIDCKLGSSVAINASSPLSPGAMQISMENCDSANTNYRFYNVQYQGVTQQETTVVLSGGASDGTTPISWKMISNANSNFSAPLSSPGIAIPWNATSGSTVNITLQVVNDGATLNNNDLWMEAVYLGTSGYPLGNFSNCTVANILISNSAIPSSSASWTTTGLSSPVTQQMTVSFTAQESGPFTIIVYLAKPSATVYISPIISVH